jgi:hypothetical protein
MNGNKLPLIGNAAHLENGLEAGSSPAIRTIFTEASGGFPKGERLTVA